MTLIGKLDGKYGPDLTVNVGIASVTNGIPGGSTVEVTFPEGDPKPIVSITPPTSILAEMGGSATFDITMNELSGVDTSITFSYGGTAALGTDFSVAGNNYNPSTKTLVIPAGMTLGQITVFGLNNQTFGPDLTAAVTMQSAVNAAISAKPTAIATITEGNAGPTVSLALSGSPMPEIGGQALVTASIPKPYSTDVLINLMFTGSAVLGVNYKASGTYFNATTNTLLLPAGATSSTLVLQAVDDGLYGPNLNAIVGIQSLSPGIAPGGPVTATITEGDAPPSVSLNASTSSISENGGQVTVTATLSAPSGFDTSVPLTFTGTAAYGTNYLVVGQAFNPNTQSLLIKAGQTSQSIQLIGVSDGLYGPNLTVVVGVGPTGPTLLNSPVNVQILESTPPPQLMVSDIGVSEAAGTAIFTAILSEPSLLPVTVAYNTFDITALAGIDYQSTSGTVTFAPGDTVQNIDVPVLDDHLYGPPSKLFGLQLNVNANATPSMLQATASLREADTQPQVSVGDVTVLKPTSGQIEATFTVTLSDPSDLTTTVNYTTSDITAKAGTDYIANSGSITFAPGETSKQVPISVLGNSSPTGNLTFGFNLTGALGASIARTQAIGTIDDVNPAVGLSVANTEVTIEGPGRTQAVFTVTLAPARLGQVVTVQYTTLDGTAFAYQDYLPTQGILTFDPGVSSLTIPVTVFGSMTNQSSKVFFLELTNAQPAGTEISIADATATIIYSIPAPVVNPLPVTATQGVLLNNVPLATLTIGTPSGPPVPPAGFFASINWGDGTPVSQGFVTSQGSPPATVVLGTHRYTLAGIYVVQITASNPSIPVTASARFQLVVAAVPIVLTGGLDPASDSGISNSDGITNVTQPVFDGTSEAFSTVKVYVQPTGGGPQQLVGTTVASASGAWSLRSSVALANGSYTRHRSSRGPKWSEQCADPASPVRNDRPADHRHGRADGDERGVRPADRLGLCDLPGQPERAGHFDLD